MREAIRIWWPGRVASAAMVVDDGRVGAEGGRREGERVRGRRCMEVGMWPPREKFVRCSNKWPWRDLGSIFH